MKIQWVSSYKAFSAWCLVGTQYMTVIIVSFLKLVFSITKLDKYRIALKDLAETTPVIIPV